jgi:hypothetical protein
MDSNKSGIGTHTATIHVASNDPDEPGVTVPVTFNVIHGHPPVIQSTDPANPFTMDEGASQEFTVYVSDPDGDPLTYSWTLDGATIAGATGEFHTYAPDFDAAGDHELTVTADDGNGGAVSHTWDVTVTDVNRDPVAVDDDTITNKDTAVTIDVLANDGDPDGDTLSVSDVTQPANGTVTNNGNDVLYTPDGGFSGTDSFEYTASDGRGGTATSTVLVEVIGRDPGDLNDDGAVNVDDLVLVTSHYGQEQGDPDWDPLADANGDGLISIDDLTDVTSNFGKTYP